MLGVGLTIVVPCYNGARWLGPLRDCLLRIDPLPEIVVVDDGSDDQSRQILDSDWSFARVIHQANRGLPGARNVGVSAASGDYILLLDCDDLVVPRNIWRLVDCAVDADADVVVGNWAMRLLHPDGRVELEPSKVVPDGLDYRRSLISGDWWAPVHAHLVRRSAYLAVSGSDEDVTNGQDLNLWLKLARQPFRWVEFDGMIAWYTRVLDSGATLSGRSKELYWRDYDTVLCREWQWSCDHGQLGVERAAWDRRFYRMAQVVMDWDWSWAMRLLARVEDPQAAIQTQSLLKRRLFGLLGLGRGLHLISLWRGLRRRFSRG